MISVAEGAIQSWEGGYLNNPETFVWRKLHSYGETVKFEGGREEATAHPDPIPMPMSDISYMVMK